MSIISIDSKNLSIFQGSVGDVSISSEAALSSIKTPLLTALSMKYLEKAYKGVAKAKVAAKLYPVLVKNAAKGKVASKKTGKGGKLYTIIKLDKKDIPEKPKQLKAIIEAIQPLTQGKEKSQATREMIEEVIKDIPTKSTMWTIFLWYRSQLVDLGVMEK